MTWHVWQSRAAEASRRCDASDAKMHAMAAALEEARTNAIAAAANGKQELAAERAKTVEVSTLRVELVRSRAPYR